MMIKSRVNLKCHNEKSKSRKGKTSKREREGEEETEKVQERPNTRNLDDKELLSSTLERRSPDI